MDRYSLSSLCNCIPPQKKIMCVNKFYGCFDVRVVFQALVALNLSFLTKIDLGVAKRLRLCM